MVTINLLPWRDYERVYQVQVLKKIFLSCIGFIGISVMSVHLTITQKQDKVRVRVIDLEQKINLKKNTQSFPVAELKMNVAAQALRYHTSTTILWSLLGRAAKGDAGVCFNEVTREKQRVTFVGEAEGTDAIGEYLMNWSPAYLFSEIKIEKIKKREDRVNFQFQAVERDGFDPKEA